MVAGALGFLPDDERLFDAFALAEQAGIGYRFEFGAMTESQHPNAVKFTLTGASGRAVSLVADSTGGGMIETRVVDGYPAADQGRCVRAAGLRPGGSCPVRAGTSAWRRPDWQGWWKPASTAGRSPGQDEGAESRSSYPQACELGRRSPGDPALGPARRAARPGRDAPGAARLPRRPAASRCCRCWTRPARKPQLFDTMTRWREVAAERGLSLAEVAIQYEMDASGWSREQVIAHMRMIERAMHRQTHAVYEEQLDVPTTPFRPDMAADGRGTWRRRAGSPTASLRRRSNGPTARARVFRACRPWPGRWAAAAVTSTPRCGRSKRRTASATTTCWRGLFVAAGVGAIAYTRTEPTGEVTGCTGETGICGAMAAAAIVAMAGGTPEEAENAASLLLQAVIGVPCDPIPGGAGQPCRSRIINTTCMAHVFADLALAGRDAILPLHEAHRPGGSGGAQPAAGAALHGPGWGIRRAGGAEEGHRLPRVVRDDRPRGCPPAAGEFDLRCTYENPHRQHRRCRRASADA